jgi:hypothetical protein
LDAIEWPGQLNTVMHRFAEFFPEKTVALTESATDLARQYDTTEAAIKEVLRRMEGVKY